MKTLPDDPRTDRVWPPTSAADRELIERLQTSSLFEGLADDQLHRLIWIGNHESFARNAFIFREGNTDARVFVVLSGSVRISRQMPGMGEEALAILAAGSAFGEMTLIDGSPRSADAIAHEDCELFVIAGQDLEDLMFVDRSMANHLLWRLVRMLTDRLRQTNEKMVFLSITGKFE